MPLAAAQIITAIAQRLAGLPLAGPRVYTSRAWPLAEAELPAWKVVAADEAIEPASVHRNALQKHELEIELRGHVRATAAVDDALHALAAEGLVAVFAGPQDPPDALDALDKKLQLTQRRIERALQTEGQAAMGLVVITLRAVFHTATSDPLTLR